MSRPPRFAIRERPDDAGVAIVDGSEFHHLHDVTRLRAGDEIALIGPDGVEYVGTIEQCDGGRAIVRVSKSVAPASPVSIILAQAIIKGPRMDFIVEKAAELGATELWPILCARGVARAPGAERLERWRRIALSAAKQSLAPVSMLVRGPTQFADLIRATPRDTLAVILTMGAQPIAGLIKQSRPHATLIACGPEGDFASDELGMAADAGFHPAGLGPNRLRSETAGMAALAIVRGAVDENTQER